MESKDDLHRIYSKNLTCCYSDDIMTVEDINSSGVLLDEKEYENILTYGISYKTFLGSKPLYIKFDKIDEFIKIYDGIRYFSIICLLVVRLNF